MTVEGEPRWIEGLERIKPNQLKEAYSELIRDVRKYGGTRSLDFCIRGMDLSIQCRMVGNQLMITLRRWHTAGVR